MLFNSFFSISFLDNLLCFIKQAFHGLNIRQFLLTFVHNEQHRLTVFSQACVIFNSKTKVLITTEDVSALITEGLVKKAAKKLGFYFSITEIVSEGNKFGRALGYPTANIYTESLSLIPAQGVYAAFVKTEKRLCKAMVNIGVRPTLNLDNEIIEAHLLDFEGNLYNRKITIYFVDYIRKEMKFSDTDSLKNQLNADKKIITKILDSIEVSTDNEGRLLV